MPGTKTVSRCGAQIDIAGATENVLLVLRFVFLVALLTVAVYLQSFRLVLYSCGWPNWGGRNRIWCGVLYLKKLLYEFCPKSQLIEARKPRKFRCFWILPPMCFKKNVAVHSCDINAVEEQRLPPADAFSKNIIRSNQLVRLVDL